MGKIYSEKYNAAGLPRTPDLTFLEAIGEISGWPYRLGVATHTNRLLDIVLID